MLVASFSLPPEGVALERTVNAIPDIQIEAERVAAHSTEWVMPCLWVAHAQRDDVADAFRSDPSVNDVVGAFAFEDETFFHVEWADDVQRRIDSYVDKGGSILEASLRDGTWNVGVRFAHREQFDEFRSRLADRDHSYRLLGLTEPGEPHQGLQDVTPAQRNALVTAAESGYFRVPRETTTDELAAELDVTHQAVSELLRRGTENLVFSTLTAERA